MPKSALCKPRVDPREGEVKALIAAGRARLGLSQKQLAEKIKASESTIGLHIRNPRDMRLGELWDILDFLKSTEEEKTKIV